MPSSLLQTSSQSNNVDHEETRMEFREVSPSELQDLLQLERNLSKEWRQGK